MNLHSRRGLTGCLHRHSLRRGGNDQFAHLEKVGAVVRRMLQEQNAGKEVIYRVTGQTRKLIAMTVVWRGRKWRLTQPSALSCTRATRAAVPPCHCGPQGALS